jgi:putative ABC transport system substrate-binding protein
MPLAQGDPQGEARITTFRKALQELGWTEGRNVRFDYRWGAGAAELNRRYAEELVALAPDVLLAGGGLVVAALQKATRSVPIVFTATLDPVTLGFVESLAKPGGNTTGFLNLEYSFSAKWLQLLKEIAPGVTRVAVLRDPTVVSGNAQFAAIDSVAASFGVALSPVDVVDAERIERSMAAFAHEATGGLIVTASIQATIHRDLIIALAARHRLPAVYPTPFYVSAGGLISYGSVFNDQYRRAADYVNRILKGAKPADLPVQAPVKYEMALNLKTAKTLGLDVPRIVFARVDQVFE